MRPQSPSRPHGPSPILLALLLAVLATPLHGQPTAPESTPAPSRCQTPNGASTDADGTLGPAPDLTSPCAEGVVNDDSTVESGYGWVPSATWGVYAQVYEPGDIRPAGVDSVCVCWLRTRDDATLDFEVVFYREAIDGIPELEPYAAFPADITVVEEGVVGQFVQVDTRGVPIPQDGPVFIGVRWDPSVDQYFFVCNDRTPETPYTNAFFIDDRAENWGAADQTNDPSFTLHRAMMIRPLPRQPVAVEVPGLGTTGRSLLALLLLLGGVGWLHRR